jgi:uncharacterized protein with GYD domain
MKTFLVEATYSPAALAAMVDNPQDRAKVIAGVLERMGGRLVGFWLAFGDRDVVCIAEVPGEIEAMALAMAIGRTGSMTAYRTTPLLASGDAVLAMRRAADTSYQAPKG